MYSPDTLLSALPGIGPARASALNADGLTTIWDLVHTVPRCLGEPPPLVDTHALPGGMPARLRAEITGVRKRFTRGRGLGLEVSLRRADGAVFRARFWRAAMLIRSLTPGSWFLFEGLVDRTHHDLLLHPSFLALPAGALEQIPSESGCRVAYQLPDGFSQRFYARLVALAIADGLTGIADPAGILEPAAYQAALRDGHAPASPASHEAARRLLAERELLAMAILLAERRRAFCSRPGRAWPWSDTLHEQILDLLPFPLTPGQREAIGELREDMQQSQPMYRLLHGDVGSGKTAMAFIASLAVIAGGGQVAWLAPTAVLARQHAQTVTAWLGRGTGPIVVRTALLTGGTPDDDRALLLADASAQRVDLIIGTHALLEEDVQLARLGLVVIDEQHKFGVEQRAALFSNNAARQDFQPDLLLMTATPIPRTVALTTFGDLAVTRILGRPAGRAEVTSSVAAYHGLAQLDTHVRSALEAGGQCFVICARREAGDGRSAIDVRSAHRHLHQLFGAHGVGLMHGEMAEQGKLSLMEDFASGRMHVLVSTSVIEVGIDVPGADLLLVLDAERFGLAQLHQMRGRLGRGGRPGRCVFLYRGAEVPARLGALLRHDDGMEIAIHDLAERGSGELLGTVQHGSIRLRIADLARDLDLLEEAHQRARRLAGAGAPVTAQLLRLLGAVPDRGLLTGG